MSALGEGLHPWLPDTSSGSSARGTAPWRTLDWCDAHEGRLLVADSWRVIEGRVRGLDRHRVRFLAAVGAHRDDGPVFWRDVVAALPRTGDWFPRVELRERGGGTQLSLRLRPTPATSTEVVVATAPRDPRTQPLIKGPDLDALQGLRVAVQPRGAGEAIIVDAQGHVIEGAYSALLWWRGETLVRVSDAVPRIPSVTADLLGDAARAAGVRVIAADARVDDLAGCELWVLSALHGVRAATRWVDGPPLAAPRHAELGRAWLRAAERDLPAAESLYPDWGTPALGA